MEDIGLSLQDLYPSPMSPIGPIQAFVLEGTKMKTPEMPEGQGTKNEELRHMAYNSGPRTKLHDDGDFSVNPDPVPFQPQNFMSSTSTKKVPIPKRHLDSFGGYEYSMGAKRGIILHTDRYQKPESKCSLMDQWDSPKVFEGLSQRERLRAELEYMERLRYVKRRREVLPHRAQLDLLMGGKKVEFVERFDIQKEIQKLKSLIMPQNARDLFHGRGIPLPSEHSSIKPRRPPMIDYDSDDERLGSSAPIILARERRTVDQIKARISIPAGTQNGYFRRSKTNVSKFDSSIPRSYTSVTRPDRSDLKVTPKAENVRRVDLPSAGTSKVLPARVKSGPLPPETEEKEYIPQDDPAMMDAFEDLTDRQKMMATSKTSSPMKPPTTPNPLRGSELSKTISEPERNALHATFKRLDTDADGHLKFDQVQTQMPKQMSQQQERFLKEVYDITSSSTFFGVDEFLMMSTLTKLVTNMTDSALTAFQSLNFASLKGEIINVVDIFQSVDRGQKGKISLDSLREVLTEVIEKDLHRDTNLWYKIVETISPSEEIQVTKIEFLAYLPYFLSLKTS